MSNNMRTNKNNPAMRGAATGAGGRNQTTASAGNLATTDLSTLTTDATALAEALVDIAVSSGDADWKSGAIRRTLADALNTGGASKAVLLALTAQHLTTVISAVADDMRGAA